MTSRLELDVAWLATAEPLMRNAYWGPRGTRGASIVPPGEPMPPIDDLVDTAQTEGSPTTKVGHWFEHVHLTALKRTPGVEIIAANVVLKAGRTLGELDVLYRQDARVVHREVAIKYYLAARPGRDPSAWYGPGRRDRLDIKLEHLATHQSTIARQAREAGAWPGLPFPDVTEVLLLGSLFSPTGSPRLPENANPRLDHGRWYHATEFADRFGRTPWCVLHKPWWLSAEHARVAEALPALALVQDLQRPCFVARVSSRIERAFVVPDGWWDEIE